MLLIENTNTYVLGISNLNVGELQPRNIILRPGMNPIEPHVWEVLRANPLIQARMDTGELSVEEVEVAETGAPSLQGLAINRAYKLIKKTFDMEVLQEWLELETRPAVSKYIDNQIKLMRMSAKKETAEDEAADELD